QADNDSPGATERETRAVPHRIVEVAKLLSLVQLSKVIDQMLLPVTKNRLFVDGLSKPTDEGSDEMKLIFRDLKDNGASQPSLIDWNSHLSKSQHSAEFWSVYEKKDMTMTQPLVHKCHIPSLQD
ncbi:hypothetical protein L9F63_024246, partial [Diploptera punctata]